MSTASEPKSTYLCCYAYGSGGLWCLVDARSASDIRARFPNLMVLDDPSQKLYAPRAEIIELLELKKIRWDLEDPPDSWLKVLAQG